MNIASFFKSGISNALVLFSIICLSPNINAQPLNGNFENNLFKRTNIVFSVTPNYTFKGKTQLITGNQDMHTQNLVSGEAGLGLIYNLNDEWGIKTGLQVGATPLDFGYDINAPHDTLFGTLSKDYASYMPPFDREYFGYINVPLQVEYRKRITDRKYFLGAAGINFKWMFYQATQYGYSSAINDTVGIRVLEIYAEQATKHVTLPLSLSAGIGFVLKNKNMLVLNVKSEIGFTNLINGSFAFFPDEPYRSVGTYTKKCSYIGLEIGYRLTKARQMDALNSPRGFAFARNEGHINHKIDSTDFEKIFRRNQIGISISYQFNLKPTIKTEKGSKPDVTGLPMPMLSADYTFNINGHWGIKTGLEMGAIIYQYNNVNYFDSVSSRNYQTEIFHYEGTYSLNVAVNYRCPISRTIYLESNVGLNTTRLFNGGTTYGYGFDFNYPFTGQNSVKGATSDKFLFGSKVGLGLLFATKNYNLWRIGIDYKYSFSAAATDSYALNRGYANEQTGTVKAKGSYVALSAGYVYSFSPSPYAVTKRRMKIETSTVIPKAKLNSADLDSIYTKNQFAITSELNFMMRPEVSIEQGSPLNIYTYSKFGFSADYVINFNKRWAIKGGLNYSGYSYDTDTYYSSGTDSTRLYYSSYNITNAIGVTASVEYRKQISHNNLWYADAGISLKKYFNTGESDLGIYDSSHYTGTITSLNSNGLITGANFETGILLTAKNYNQWKFGVTYFQSFTTLLKQDYSFTNPTTNQINKGTVTASGSYFGINVGYIFSLKKKEKR